MENHTKNKSNNNTLFFKGVSPLRLFTGLCQTYQNTQYKRQIGAGLSPVAFVSSGLPFGTAGRNKELRQRLNP